ncbi:MAG: GTPase Era [Acidimicrobiia bacterium]|nr:GTPase Era [Acidimicrobiia bacterium]
MKSGFVSFLGRPNAGKSTLLNRIVGHKLAIVSDKPQTTRTRIVGVKNYDDGQVVFVDTPGVHKPTHRMNVRMVDVALEAMREVDVLTLVVDASVKPGPGDRYMLDLLKDVKTPAILVLNKVGLIAKHRLLPLIDHYRRAHPFVELVPVSAVDGTNVDVLEKLFLQYLPEGEPLYPADYVTDQPERFFVSEIVREQVLQLTHDELPFSTAVMVDRLEDAEGSEPMRIYCTILVERESQKPIVIGKAGAMIKQIGTAARAELEKYFDRRVFLDLHVKVKSEWRDDERLLDELGLQGRDRG